MSTLLIVLAGISLLDSTSIISVCIVPLAAILGGSRPVAAGVGFLAGIFLTTLAVGVSVFLGLDVLFDAIGPTVSRLWNQPNAAELITQAFIGGALLAFGWRLRKPRQAEDHTADSRGAVSPGRALGLGAGLTIVGLPGAIPYLGAIDLILRADLGPAASGFALVFYCIVFVLPLTILLIVRMVLPEKSEGIFRRVAEVAERWGRQLVVAALVIVGVVLLADAVGWFLGSPLLPVA